MKQALVLILALHALSSCSVEANDPNPSPLGCEVALASAEEFTREVRDSEITQNRRLALNPASTVSAWTEDELRDLVENDPALVDDPEFELVLASAKHRDVNVLEQCDLLRQWAERENVLSDQAEIARLTQTMEWPVVVLTQSMPVVTEDGRRAMVYTSEYAGSLAGASFVTLYERGEDGAWQVADRRMLSIS